MKPIADKSSPPPVHYVIPGMDIQVIDLIHAYSKVATNAWDFFLWSSALQYVMRYSLKGEPSKDLGKAITYLTWLKQAVDYRRPE